MRYHWGMGVGHAHAHGIPDGYAPEETNAMIAELEQTVIGEAEEGSEEAQEVSGEWLIGLAY